VRDRRDELVEWNRVERDVAAQLFELQRLVVHGRGAGREGQHILLRRFRVHGNEKVDLFLAADVPLGAGADGVPRGQPGNIRREHVLAGDRNAHLEYRSQEDQVRSLASRSVDGGDLNGEIVDDALRARERADFLDGSIGR
jgi:hypothetical protein